MPGRKHVWKPADMLLLRQMVADGCHSDRDIAKRLRITENQVKHRRWALKLPALKPQAVPCAVRDRIKAIMARRRMTWGGVERMIDVDRAALKRWGIQNMAATPELLAAITALCERLESFNKAETAPAKPDISGVLPLGADAETATDWLYYELLRGGCDHAGAMQRINILTETGIYREANARRLALGLPPYVRTHRAFA
jgi:hypothetical protein